MLPKRILVVSPVPTHPPGAGNRARMHRLVTDFRALGHEVHLLFVPDRSGDLEAMRVWLDGRLRVLESPGPVVRMPLGFRLANRLAGGRLVRPGFRYLADVDDLFTPGRDRELAGIAADLEPDVVLVCYAAYSRVLEHFGPRTLKLLDTQDRLAGRHWQQWRRGVPTQFMATSARQERRAVERADVVVAIQDDERRFFEGLASTPVVTLGHRVTLDRLPLRRADGPPQLLFLASDNGMNLKGINAFIRRVLPRLRARFPGLRLLLAGPISRCPRVAPGAGLHELGVVDDVAKAYELADVVVNPAAAGTGLHVKNVEAMGYARPLVMSAAASRGITEGAGRAYLIARSPRGFARAVASLLEGHARAERLADRAYRFAEAYNERMLRRTERLLERG